MWSAAVTRFLVLVALASLAVMYADPEVSASTTTEKPPPGHVLVEGNEWRRAANTSLMLLGQTDVADSFPPVSPVPPHRPRLREAR